MKEVVVASIPSFGSHDTTPRNWIAVKKLSFITPLGKPHLFRYIYIYIYIYTRSGILI